MEGIDDHGSRLNITIWSLTGVATLFLALRIYCKVRRGRPVRSDDCVLVASWVNHGGNRPRQPAPWLTINPFLC